MGKLFNLARMSTATVGTGTITLGSAVSGFLTFAGAGVSNGDVVSYAIADGSNSEIGTGTYTSAGTTLTRTVNKSTNGNAAISLSGAAQVFITPRAEDLNTTPTTQVFTSGSGTYTTPAGVLWLEVELIGGGGGGGAGGTGGNNGTGGTATTLGTLTGNGGSGGIQGAAGGAGGTASGGYDNQTGGTGEHANIQPTGVGGGFAIQGGSGGNGIYGGAASGGNGSIAAGTAAANSGGGGGGGTATVSGQFAGSGGGSGGSVKAIIGSPAATYSYAVGGGGAGGTIGTGAQAGSAGAAGKIVVREHYTG
jgi:hypothetical protein